MQIIILIQIIIIIKIENSSLVVTIIINIKIKMLLDSIRIVKVTSNKSIIWRNHKIINQTVNLLEDFLLNIVPLHLNIIKFE